ncbi:MAG: hypothetical protein ACXVC6_09845 [Bacteroidia bacterium]
MKKILTICFFYLAFFGKAQNDKEFGSIAVQFLNETRGEYKDLEGQLLIDRKANKFKTDDKGCVIIKNVSAGKHTLKWKVDKCCVFEIKGINVLAGKPTWKCLEVLPKNKSKDTCIKIQEYIPPIIEPASPSTISREMFLKKGNK